MKRGSVLAKMNASVKQPPVSTSKTRRRVNVSSMTRSALVTMNWWMWTLAGANVMEANVAPHKNRILKTTANASAQTRIK